MTHSGALESNSQGTEKNVGESKRQNSSYSNTEKESLSQSNSTRPDIHVGGVRDGQSSKRKDENKGYSQGNHDSHSTDNSQQLKEVEISPKAASGNKCTDNVQAASQNLSNVSYSNQTEITVIADRTSIENTASNTDSVVHDKEKEPDDRNAVKNTAEGITEKQNKESNPVKHINMAGEETSSVEVSPDEITPPATNISPGLLEKGALSKLDCKENGKIENCVVKDKDLNLEEMSSLENTAPSANSKPNRTFDQTVESESLHLKNNENTGVNQGFTNRPYIKKEPSQAINTTKMSPDVQTTDDKEYISSSTRDRNTTVNTEAIQAVITERTEFSPNVEINYEKDNISSKTSNTDTKEEIKDEGNGKTEKDHDVQTTDEIKDKGNERTEKSLDVQITDETKDKGNETNEKSHDVQTTDEIKDKENEKTGKSQDVQTTEEIKDKGNERTEKSHDVQITDETKGKGNETTEKSLDVQTTDDRENSGQTSDADTAPLNKDKLHKNDVHFDDGEEEKEETKQRAQKTKQKAQNIGKR